MQTVAWPTNKKVLNQGTSKQHALVGYMHPRAEPSGLGTWPGVRRMQEWQG